MSYETLRIRQQPGVCFIQLYRPEAQNALNVTLMAELMTQLCLLEGDPTINVIVLEGWPQVFCSGMDLQEYAVAEHEEEARMTTAFAVLRQLAESTKIVVARIEGRVNAGGIGLVAACDLVIAENAATFALSELLFGLLPAMVLPFLQRRIGYHRAKLLALSTQPLSAAEAQRWGLVDLCGADPDQLLRPYLQRWRALSAPSIQRLKGYMNQLQPIDLATQTLAIQTIGAAMADAEVKAGIRRYVEEGIAPWMR